MGAGLVEVLVATVMISVVTLLLVEFFARGRVWFDHEEHKRVATLLAQEAMERTVARPYAQIGSWSEERTIASVAYEVRVTMQNHTPEHDMKTVRTEVEWHTAPRTTRHVTLASFVREH